MKIGIINEQKNPQDHRLVFSPSSLFQLKQLYTRLDIKVEHSDTRFFDDKAYQDLGIEVANDISDCDVFFGVNEVPVESLIENKTYFFFSNCSKGRSHDSSFLQALLKKNINYFDCKTLVETHHKYIDFDKYAGIIATYNAIRAFGIKFELFKLPKASALSGKEALLTQLKRQVLPPLKFVVTGTGSVESGVREILEALKIKSVSIADFLNKKYTQSVYTQLDVSDYNKRKDAKAFDTTDFFQHPDEYSSDFQRFTKVADVYIAAHFQTFDAPEILTRQMLQEHNCKIKIVASISDDLHNAIACLLRYSTIVNPFYGYLPSENKEIDLFHPAAVVVTALNKSCFELPKDASQDLGILLIETIIPAFINGDTDGILLGAKITENGKLGPRFS